MNNLFSERMLIKDSSDSEDDTKATDSVKSRSVVFHCAPESSITLSTHESLFTIDTNAAASDNGNVEVIDGSAQDTSNTESTLKIGSNLADKTTFDDSKNKDNKSDDLIDTDVKKLLSKCQIGVGFEKTIDDSIKLHTSKKELWRLRKMERQKTKGSDWFNLPATELTEEHKRDLEIIQMRDALDLKTHYKKNDRSILPKYFEVGTVLENKADFYSSRIPKKLRKRTIVEELLADTEFRTKQRKKFEEIRARQSVARKGAFQHRTYRKRKTRITRHH